MDKHKNYFSLKKFALNQAIDLFGVADISKVKTDFMLSKETLEKFDKAICLAVRLSQSVLEEITDAPTKLYFHHYRTVNAFLDQAAFKVCNYIQKIGYSALPIPASQILDWENQKAHLSHKQLGMLAGLGWIGRNNLLVNEKFGSQFRLVSVLTDLPLRLDKPSKKICGECHMCIAICPSRAIKQTCADFDHIKCFEKLKGFQKQKLVDQYICGVCVNICRGKEKLK